MHPRVRDEYCDITFWRIKEARMKKGEKLVVVGCSGSGGPAAMLAKKLLPEVEITVIRKEEFFIVR